MDDILQNNYFDTISSFIGQEYKYKKNTLTIFMMLFLNANYVSVRDIELVTYNKFEEKQYVLDLDSIKKVSDKILAWKYWFS